jgi:hypothetical protein
MLTHVSKTRHLFGIAIIPLLVGIAGPLVLAGRYGVEAARHLWSILFLIVLGLALVILIVLRPATRVSTRQSQPSNDQAQFSKAMIRALSVLIVGGLLAINGYLLYGLCVVVAGSAVTVTLLNKRTKATKMRI